MFENNDTPLEWRFTGYIEKVIIHARIDYLRHHGRIYDHEELVDEVPESVEQADDGKLDDNLLVATVTAATLEQIATGERLYRAIRSLSPTEKEVLYQLFILERNTKEAALAMGVTINWIHKLKKRTLSKLRTAFEQRED